MPHALHIDAAARVLIGGGLVAIPTETVYGLAADATQEPAVAAIFEAKGRPRFNPLISHLPDAAAVWPLVEADNRAQALAQAFWPGPLTLVLRRAENCPVSLLACAGLPTIAVRVPAHPLARDLLAAVGRPVAAPSANRSGRISPTAADHVYAQFGETVPVLDGGPCIVGLESTVVDLTTDRPVILRAGGLSAEDIAAVAGPIETTAGHAEHDPDAPRAPGMLIRHYAPGKPLRLILPGSRPEPGPGEALLAFGPDIPPGFASVLNLSPTGDPAEAAANLFAMLVDLDAGPFPAIAAMTVPERGLGVAINDRLRRAAAGSGTA